MIPVIGLTLVALFTILYVNHTYLYNKTISAIIAYPPPYSHPFIDWKWIPSSIECWHRVVDVYLSIPCYAPSLNGLSPTFDYSPLWLRLTFIRFAEGWTNLFGLSFAVVFFLSLTLMPLQRMGIFDFVIMLLSAISSATVLLLERANADLIMFFMIILGVSACGSWLPARLGGYGLITLAGLLKFYPMIALIITIRERPLIFATIALAVIAALAAFVSIYYKELVLVVGGLVSGAAIFNPVNWGAKQLPGGLSFIISRVAAKLFHQDAMSADTIGQFLYSILLLLLVVQALATAIWLGHRSRLQYAVADLSLRETEFLLAGAALICGCFFTGDNAPL
jgi:hypothetical protein